MKKLPLIFLGLLMAACSSPKLKNPLLNADDGQFIRAMNFSISECENVFFNPSAVKDPLPNYKESCARRVKKNAAHAGISEEVTLEHIEDPKVKERYFSIKK